MEISIRKYTVEDARSILDIVNYNILHSTALYDYEPRTLENQITIFDDKLAKGFPIIVAIESLNVVGFGYYSEFRYREAYKYTVEHSVYAHPDHKGKGIGKLLLTELIKLAQQQQLHTMIGVIDSENKESIDFHKKFGFQINGILHETGFKYNRWLDSVFMQKML